MQLIFWLFRFVALAAIALVSPAQAATEIMWWHAMSGELGKQLEKLAADFNASQSDYRIVPSYKGNYTETVTAAIFAFRSRSHDNAQWQPHCHRNYRVSFQGCSPALSP